MTGHLFLPGLTLEPGSVHPAYAQYLSEWREEAISRADGGDAAASVCHQAALIDLAQYGEVRHAWHEVMDSYLTHAGLPLAYSEVFGQRLHSYGAQYKQTTIHAIHTRWWMEGLLEPTTGDHSRYARLVLAKRQTDGLIYDADVSETILRHRMKVELTLSMAMAAEILQAAGLLAGNLPLELATSVVDPSKCPTLGYMSMEFFRLHALRVLGYPNLFPTGIAGHIAACAEDLAVGWGDFSIQSKVDAYMGTAKRTQRDKPIHSPLIACHVASLAEMITDAEAKTAVAARLDAYGRYLRDHPLDIPAFQMRDVPIPFGADRTPIEAICASHLIARYGGAT